MQSKINCYCNAHLTMNDFYFVIYFYRLKTEKNELLFKSQKQYHHIRQRTSEF